MRHVDDDAPPGGDGLSWDTAYRFLQDALTTATEGSEIRVAQGTYTPDPGNREESFLLVNGAALQGGYAGLGAPDPDERDIERYETILSGDLLGDDGPAFTNNDDNAYHVVTANGGGMLISGTPSPVLINCSFMGNVAWLAWPVPPAGGGIDLQFDTEPALFNCVFSGNAAAYGGGISVPVNARLKLINCTFTANTAAIDGGAIYDDTQFSFPPEVANCIVWGNTPNEFGQTTAPLVSYSNVQGGYPGMGNIDAEPLFVDSDGEDDLVGTEDDDLRLMPGSPCIDAGRNQSLVCDEFDLDGDGETFELTPLDRDGNPRFADDPKTTDPGCGVLYVVDMGAYEFPGTAAPSGVRYADLDGNGSVGITDFLALIASWGSCEGCCPADLGVMTADPPCVLWSDPNGLVTIDDMQTILFLWGL